MRVALALCGLAALPRPARAQSWTGGPTGPIYYNGGNVGIGTATPSYQLDLYGYVPLIIEGPNTYQTGFVLSNSSSGAGWQFLVGGSGNGPGAAGVGGFALYNGAFRFNINANGKVGIGTTTPQYLLSVDGTLGAKEVIVTNTGWSDYVFQRGYRLRPLSEIKRYIQANHHLPDIPSEAEVKAQGVSVGEMQSKLLAKIEELTLHLIRQEQENQELRARVARLEANAAGGSGRVASK